MSQDARTGRSAKPISRTELARRLRQARDVAGLTQEAVSRVLGISRTAIALIENGTRSVSSFELDRMAQLYKREMQDFFTTESDPQNALAGLFRAHSDIAENPQFVNALRHCVCVGRELTNIERAAGIARDPTSAVRYRVSAPRSRFEAIRQGASIADQERRRLGIGQAPMPDVAELLEKHGIRTAIVDLPQDISGLTLIDAEAGPLIAVNRREHILRRNFSLAHEYAHVLVDCDATGRISRSSERAELLEVRANSFAANLLMPEAGVREMLEALGKNPESRLLAEIPIDGERVTGIEARGMSAAAKIQMHDVVLMAHHFGVSRQVVLYRLRNLRAISNRELRDLLDEEQGGRGRQIEKLLELPGAEHAKERNRFRHRFLSLALEAHRREAITRDKLEELFALLLENPRGQLALSEYE